MTVSAKGNIFEITLNPGEYTAFLPAGYSFESLIFTYLDNTVYANNHNITINTEYHYPVVKSKSPCIIQATAANSEKPIVLRCMITKFGQIPDPHYFDNAFDTILVTGADGNDYKVIPSDQFK